METLRPQFENFPDNPPERTQATQTSIERLHEDALTTESYEEAVEAVASVEALQKFRSELANFPFGSFSEAVEVITHINRQAVSQEEKSRHINTAVEKMKDRAVRLSPRVADMFNATLAAATDAPYEPRFEENRRQMEKLTSAEAQRSDLDVLFAGDISWELKLNRMENVLHGYLSGIRALDRRDRNEMDDDMRQWRARELAKAPTKPPARKNESRPGVDPMERLKEGERAPAMWSINPAWGGYYKEQSFSRWDSNANTWVEDKYSYSDVEAIPLSGNRDAKKGPIDITMRAQAVAGQWVSLPTPYTHDFHKLEAGDKRYSIQKDQNGDLVVLVEGQGEEVDILVSLAAHPDKKFKSQEPLKIAVPEMPAELSEETIAALDKIRGEKRGNIDRARAIRRYVVSRIQYLAPKDRGEAEQYNNIYRTSPKGFAGAVDEIRKGDCDVVNTYFAALCAKLDVPVRHVVGHSVKGKDNQGNSNINSGTGHGWSEVWNEVAKEWVRMDATPAGDPNLEEDRQKGDQSAPGDYGEQEAVRPSDEQLEELRKKLDERKEQLSYTKEERELAETAGVELKEARQIVKEINEAENTRLPNGERVVDALTKLFNAIVESRKSVAQIYEGPVRKREGGEAIQDIVRHKIGMLAGDIDPLSRELPAQEMQEEKILGGFDLYVIGDKSGSMQSTAEDGERLWQMQRRAMYLIFSSLHRFERSAERAGLQKDNALSVRTQSLSFRDDDPESLDLDKPLSPHFTAQDKVTLWHSLAEQGSGNGDAAALSYVLEQIKSETEDMKDKGLKDNRLRLVIACSDGGYVGSEGQMRALAEELAKLNVIVVGMGLTETAASVPVVMDNPPHSRGDIARDINDLPALVAKHIVLEAVKLFPEKAKASAQQITQTAIDKFSKIK